MLKHSPPPQRGPFAWFNRQFDRFTLAFGDAVVFMIKRMSVAFVLLAVLIWGLVHLFRTIPTSFVPNEDQGYLMAPIVMPDAASLDRTSSTTEPVDKLFAKNPGGGATGRSSTASACSTASTRPTRRPSS